MNRDEVFLNIHHAREIFCSKRQFTALTEEQFQGMIKGLAFVFFHAPQDIAYMVEATINEASMRRVLMETRRLLK
jgi:hypothetical protein